MNYIEQTQLEILLDLWLVSHGGREACLHFIHPENSEAVFDFAKELGLKWTCVPGKPDVVALFFRNPTLEHDWDDQEHLRTILGYSYGKEDFQSRERPAYNPTIYAVVDGWKAFETPILVQLFYYHAIADLRVYNFSKQKLKLWRRILFEHPFPDADRVQLTLFMSYDDGLVERRRRVEDWSYVQQHYDAYVQDLRVAECTPEEFLAFREPPSTEQEWIVQRELWVRAGQ